MVCTWKKGSLLPRVSLFPLRIQIEGEGAVQTVGHSPAMCFANCDCQRMKLIKELRSFLDGISGERIARELYKGVITSAVLFRIGPDELVTPNNAPEILIRYRHGVSERIKQDRICSLRANSGKVQQSVPTQLRRSRGKPLERSSELCIDHGNKTLKRGRLSRVKARRPYVFH